ncbi:alpha/beta hydrolase [Paracoccus sp. Z330]|uniref:Alpha/beta hydrolase n=1 Tax=Paracoccus onchidii TaxID=3017813 RepID=A0ABT4ZI91_9RHOB|nr:alpha/beta hydrolase [Paracoccus onchidii]MDB6179045.1 alpha/beta hydrolase [Paracoccus onchidii]
MKKVTFTVAATMAMGLTAAQAVETGTMQVDGAELTFIEQGEGPPIVFVHGAISDARVWEGYADRISEEGRFVAYTQRYFGTADWPDDGSSFTRDTHIADLIAFIEGLDAGPVDLVTWSYSGEIATYAALQRPDLFRSMVHFEPDVDRLIDGLPGADAARAQFGATVGPMIAALEAGDAESAALRIIESVFRMPEGTAGEEPEPFPTYWKENGRTLPFYGGMAPGAPLTCDNLAQISVPTLVVLGTDTLVQWAMMSERVAECSGNSMLVRMDGVTHDGPYKRPDRFTNLIIWFRSLNHEPSAGRAEEPDAG